MATVTIFSCIERFIGFLYRIFLSRNLGAEFLGIYQITLSVVGVLITLTASGIPITVSRLMLKERANGNVKGEKDVVSAGILSSLIISVPIVLALYFCRNSLSFIFADQRCYDLLLIILPGITITSVYAVIRGYFWGNKYFFTYSLIELIEEMVMCVVGVILVKKSCDKWIGTLSASKSVLISYVVSFTLSTLVFTFKSGKITNPVSKLKPLLISSTPITLMRTLTSFLNSVIAIILPQRLIYYGLTNTQALERFGEISGMALPLLFIPATVIGSIAIVMVPKLSESFYKKQFSTLNFSIDRAIDYSLLIASLVIPVFTISGKEIGSLVYNNLNAGTYLSVSAFLMIPMSVTMISNSILNSLNKERRTLLYFLISGIFMVLTIFFATKFIGIYSLILGYFLSYVITSVLNLLELSKLTHNGGYYIKQIALFTLSVVITIVFNYFLHGIFYNRIGDIFIIIIVSVLSILFETLLIQVLGFFDFRKIFK